jgi:hypothetical protein
MPRDSARDGTAVTAATCRERSLPTPARSQSVAVSRATIVSGVVNDLEHATTSVAAGSSPARASPMAAPSRLAVKRTSTSGWARWPSASWAMAGPRWEPPMPRLTTARIGAPVAPVRVPARMPSARSAMRSNPARPSGARWAACVAARPSVGLTSTPASIRAQKSGTSRWRARSARAPSTSSSTGWRDQSTHRSPTAPDSRAARSGSWAKRSRSEVAPASSASASSVAQAGALLGGTADDDGAGVTVAILPATAGPMAPIPRSRRRGGQAAPTLVKRSGTRRTTVAMAP